MYSSKSMHKYTGAQFLSGKYVDPHKIDKASSRYGGKQFTVLQPKKGNASDPGVLFSTFKGGKGDSYKDSNKYLDKYPLENRKLGFGTKDAPKTDEFLSSQRAEQYKEAMEKTESMVKKAHRNSTYDERIEKLQSKIKEIDSQYPDFDCSERDETDFVAHVPKKLYDIGRSEKGTTCTLLHDGRDQFYSIKKCKRSDKPRHVQRLAVSSADYGLRRFQSIKSEKVSSLGPRRNGSGATTFVDRTHLNVADHHH